jgi:hypothetical protein
MWFVGRPLEAFGEIFGSDESRRKFEEEEVTCPFDPRLRDGKCVKKSDRTSTKIITGNCSLDMGGIGHVICPHRFYYDNFQILREIRDFVWGSEVEANVYDEIKLSKRNETQDFNFGNLDWILVRSDGSKKFIGVEIQANNTSNTGSVQDAIRDLLNNDLKTNYSVNTNTLDSVKKFTTQFIFKGQLFDDWKMPYVAVLQDELWNYLTEKFKIRSRRIEEYNDQTFLFFIYKMELDENGTRYVLKRSEIRASRWIDFLMAYAVNTELLLDRNDAYDIIDRKMERRPILTL